MSDTGLGQGCTAQQESPISSNLTRLSNEASELNRKLSLLLERLETVSESPSPSEVERDAEKQDRGRSSIAGRIEGIRDSLRGESARIDDVLQRLEI